jgi:diguanylate cyclase (GGDEF)-like protein
MPPPLVAAVREFIAAGTLEKPQRLSISPLSRAYGEAWHVPVLIAVSHGVNDSGKPGLDGRDGVLVLHLDLGYLLSLYQDIDIGGSGILQVFESTGTELARARRGGLEVVEPGQPAVPFPEGGPVPGSTIGPLLKEDRPYLSSLHRSAPYPIVIKVSQALDEILAQHEQRKKKHLAGMTALTVIALALMAAATYLVRRLRLFFDTVVRSEREKAELIELLEGEKRRAYELASHDHLTGLANRRMFLELASSHLARARRSRQHYALMFLDLDRFKVINDSLGHRVGDLLLQTVTRRLREMLRESDVIARFGGDEFVILLTGLEQEADVVNIAEKLVAGISKPCTNLDGHDVQVGPSIGVALYPRDGQDLDTLVRHADAAMYQSKKVSRGTFTFFDPALNVTSAREFDLEQRLPKAIADGEFVLHYQPKVELEDFRVVGLEALVRWQHPEHGLIFPGDFIPIAEGTGQIVPLGNWVLEAACQQLAAWRREGLPLVPVAVNLSARQLRESELARHILERLQAHGLSPDLLHVEVTESTLVEHLEIAGGILDKLAKAGISISLDDFGNGFSSLGYIKTLPIDTIKIDRVFVRDIINSPDDAVIVQSTIILAHNLGMRVIAEGIESRAQLMHLKTAGCDEVQGYYFSRPVDREAAGKLLLDKEIIPT